MSRKFFALENAELIAGAGGELTAEDMVAAGEGVEEVAVDAAEVDELATAIEDAEVAADNLEETAEVLEAGVESGEGVTEQTAQAAEIAVEAALNMLGASHRQQSLMPSLESWGSGMSRLQATPIALESVTDKIKEIWKKVVEFVKMIAQKVIDFFAKFFDNTDRLKKNVVKARMKVNEAGAGKPKEKTVKSGSAANAFNDGQGKADFATAVSILDTHLAVSGSAVGLIAAASGTIEKMSKADKDGVASLVSGIADAFTGGKNGEHEGAVGKMSEAMIGGRRIFIGATKGAEPEFVMAVVEPEKKATKEAAALDKAQCLTLLSKVDDLATSTEAYKKIKDKINGLTKATASLADAAVQAADNEGSMAGVRKAVTSVARNVNRMVTMLPSWNVKLGNVAIGYVLSSVSNFEVAEKKK